MCQKGLLARSLPKQHQNETTQGCGATSTPRVHVNTVNFVNDCVSGEFLLATKNQNAPNLSGRGFLQERVYTDFYFFVKRNFELFLFFLELVSFQEHSCRIPQSIFPCAALASPGSAAIQKEDPCRII